MRLRQLLAFGSMIACLALGDAPVVSQSTRVQPATRPAPEPQMSDEDAAKFVAGNLLFVSFHELGHALVSEFGIPVIGRQEDGVDRLAIWMMTPEKSDTAPDPELLIHSVSGWQKFNPNTSNQQIAWWEAHGTDQQRSYQIGCLLYGSNPPIYKKLADRLMLPPARRASCAREAAENARSWTLVMKPHIRTGGERGLAAPASIVIDYAPTREYADEREFLMQLQLLESLRTLVWLYKFRSGVTLRTQECGEINAFWNPARRTLTVCYELATRYGEIAQDEQERLENQSARK